MNAAPAGITALLERYFRLTENNTTVRREILGGLTTFMTMAYIIVVNPQILAQSGMPAEGVLFATCISSAIATLVMGLWANYPLALAPGMSLNAYFTYSVCLGMHVPWQTALGAVFISGALFLVLTVSRIREQIVNGIPNSLKHSTVVGIGLFIAFVGLRNAKIVVANPATFVGLGERGKPAEAVAALAVEQLLAFETVSGAAVDPHSADQIVLPLAFAAGRSEFTVSAVTEHLRTNVETIAEFLEREITIVVPEDEQQPPRGVIE